MDDNSDIKTLGKIKMNWNKTCFHTWVEFLYHPSLHVPMLNNFQLYLLSFTDFTNQLQIVCRPLLHVVLSQFPRSPGKIEWFRLCDFSALISKSFWDFDSHLLSSIGPRAPLETSDYFYLSLWLYLQKYQQLTVRWYCLKTWNPECLK